MKGALRTEIQGGLEQDRGTVARGGAGEGGRPQTVPRCMSLNSGDFWNQVNVAHASKTKIVKSTQISGNKYLQNAIHELRQNYMTQTTDPMSNSHTEEKNHPK